MNLKGTILSYLMSDPEKLKEYNVPPLVMKPDDFDVVQRMVDENIAPTPILYGWEEGVKCGCLVRGDA